MPQSDLLAKRSSLYRSALTRDKSHCIVVQTGPGISESPEETAKQIVEEILDVASKMELPPEVMDGLSQLVVRGIKEAEQKISQAQEESVRPDKLLRNLPLVGSLVNWFSPPPPEVSSQSSHRPTVSHSFDIRSNARTPSRSRAQGSISSSPASSS